MKQFLKRLATFLSVGVIAYVLMLIAFGELLPNIVSRNLNSEIGGYGHTHTRVREARSYGATDILFLGPSLAYRGFDPRIFQKEGYRIFNLGTGSQTPLQGQVLLKRYLKELTPALVVYEVYPWCFTSDGVESSMDLLINDQIDSLSYWLAWQHQHLKVYNTLIYAAYRQVSGLDVGFQEAKVKGEDIYINGGFVEKKLSYHSYEDHSSNHWAFDESQFRIFEENLQLIEKSGAKLLLLRAPVTFAYDQSFDNNDDFDQRMETYGDFINFNSQLPLKDSLHFYDYQHLNQIGVEIFNNALLDSLRGYHF